MVEIKRHFRFPVFEDGIGAKDNSFESPYKKLPENETLQKSDIIEHEEQIVEDKEEVKRKALHLKKDASAAICDNIDYDVLKNRVKEQTKQFTKSSSSSAFEKRKEKASNKKEEKVVNDEKTLAKKDNKKQKINSNVAKEYKSFANEPVESINEDENLSNEIEKIPLVKREMIQTRESITDSVPFHRKHKKG